MRPLTKREAAAASVAAIRAKYPDPVVDPRTDSDDYCVLIAAVRCGYFGQTSDGPFHEIVFVNDSGDFERAWKLLEDVLAT